jgi:hypothetical protein
MKEYTIIFVKPIILPDRHLFRFLQAVLFLHSATGANLQTMEVIVGSIWLSAGAQLSSGYSLWIFVIIRVQNVSKVAISPLDRPEMSFCCLYFLACEDAKSAELHRWTVIGGRYPPIADTGSTPVGLRLRVFPLLVTSLLRGYFHRLCCRCYTGTCALDKGLN